jgi:putative SOS response-associated peptidase YedK
MVLLRWGLIPFFASSLSEVKNFSTINARAESITKPATWRESFKRRRCIVPADLFYEWLTITRTQKQPYAIKLKSGEPLAFAGLWDARKEPKGRSESVHTPDTWLQSFSISTTEANELMSEIHSVCL